MASTWSSVRWSCRRRVVANLWNAIVLGILPFAAAAFLTWILVKTMLASPAPQNWALVGTLVVGIILLLSARFIQKSDFVSIPRESAGQASHRASSRAL